MTRQIFANVAASISELKTNPMKVVTSGMGMPIAVLNRNEPVFYCPPANVYEIMLELFEDLDFLAADRCTTTLYTSPLITTRTRTTAQGIPSFQTPPQHPKPIKVLPLPHCVNQCFAVFGRPAFYPILASLFWVWVSRGR